MSHLSLPLRLGQRVLGSKIISLRPGVFSRAVHPSRVSMDEKPSEPPGASEIDPKEKLKELLKRVKVTKQADSEAEAESKLTSDEFFIPSVHRKLTFFYLSR